jgi:uncharacterized damage-inducible protein DinB
MKELLRQFVTYNIWAHQKIMDIILSLPEEKHKAELPSSFSSLYKTALHVWDADSIWWQRIVTPERIIAPSTGFNGTMNDIADGLLLQSQQWLAWVNEVSEESLNEIFHYRNLKGEPFSQPIRDVVLHICNHGTYHRGQLVNMLRQMNVTGIPQTDFIVWARNVQ